LRGREVGRERCWGREGVWGSGEVGYGCFPSKEEGIYGTVMFGLFCEESGGLVPTRKDGGEGLLCVLAFCFRDLFEDPDLD